jgi:topoisomerase IA-like protein
MGVSRAAGLGSDQSMSIIRVGSTSSYAEGWEAIFGAAEKGTRKASGKTAAAKKTAAKKVAAKKTAKKKAAKK